ncbi:MAG: hypothetical protein AB7G68_06620 [Nitrospiraceae bacterium]
METLQDRPTLNEDYTDAVKEPMKWTEQTPSIRLADLVEEITAYLLKYVHFPKPDIAPVIALWIVQTYCFEQFYYCGYIAIRSEQPGSGKTVLLNALGALCKGNPPPTVSPTEAVLFRGGRKVWLMDEVDNLRNQDAAAYGRLIGVLNSGFQENGTVFRMVKEKNDYKEKSFSTYGPKAFAGLKKLASTISDRCFHVPMNKTAKRMQRMTPRWLRDVAALARANLDTWAQTNAAGIRELYDEISELGGLTWLQRYDTRFQDIAEPLVVLAALADAEYAAGPRLLKALQRGLPHLVGERKPTGEQLIRAIGDLEEIVLSKNQSDFIPSEELLDMVRGAGFWWINSTKSLAAMLSTVSLFPRSNGTVRGYHLAREWFRKLENSIRQGANPATAAGF